MSAKNISEDLGTLGMLVKRGVKLFVSDKMSLFFSMLAPIIILLLYVLFLGDIQMDTIEELLKDLPVGHKVLRSMVDGWMLAGVLSTSCITVSFSAQTLMISDRESGVISDMLTSPIKRGVLSISYFVINFIITLVINVIVMILAFIYLAATGWYLSAGDAFEILGVLILSALAASLLSSVICLFIKTQSAHGAFTGILSAAIGFFIGAYMPISIFPSAIQYIALILHGTYSAGIMRNLFMRGALSKIAQISPAAMAQVEKSYSMTLDAFGKTLSESHMWMILAAFTVVLAIVYMTMFTLSKQNSSFINMFTTRRAKSKGKGGEEA